MPCGIKHRRIARRGSTVRQEMAQPYMLEMGTWSAPRFLNHINGEFPASFPPWGNEDAVKQKRSSVEQIVAVLKQAEMGAPVADLIRHLGIVEQTFYRWKRQYAGLESEQVREFKQLQDEHAKLKRLVAD